MHRRDRTFFRRRGPLTKTGSQPPSDLEELYEDAPCGLLRLRADGTLLRVNRRFCAWTGHSADALVGKRRLQDLLTIGGKIFYQTHWFPLLQMQGSVSEVKLEIVPAAGAPIPVMANAVRQTAEAAHVVDVALFVAHDRDAYERELVAAQRRLEAAATEAAKLHADARTRATFAEQMIGIVSHDLRNPLSTIHMAANLLSEEASGTQKGMLDRILRATKRSNALIGDLLDFTQARIGRGLSVDRTSIALHRVVADAVDELRLAHTERRLVHETEGSGECEADADRLAQVIGNLVSNACTYGLPGRPVVVVSAIEDERFSIAVKNEGTPIPAELHATMFEPLVRGKDSLRSGRSIGLGLFIVEQIARAHGGNAFVRSTAEEGTTIGIVLPRHASA